MVLPNPNPTKSYWIEAANSPLRDYRSTESLPTETDVVIIGSGYAGATTAYWLHKFTQNASKKPKVLMLDARDICGSATGRNGQPPSLLLSLHNGHPYTQRTNAD